MRVFAMRIAAPIWVAMLAGCPWTNHGGYQPPETTSSPIRRATSLQPSGPTTKAARFDVVTVTGASGAGLARLGTFFVGVQLTPQSGGGPVLATATVRGDITSSGWETKPDFNGAVGQNIYIRFLDPNGANVVEPWLAITRQVRCDTNQLIIDGEHTFPRLVFDQTTQVEFVLQPYAWKKCGR